MKKNRIILLTILIISTMSTIVFAAYGKVITISNGYSSYSPSTNKNAITHSAISKEQLADANKIKRIKTTSISTINGKVEGRMGTVTGNTSYDKVEHTYYRTPNTNNYAVAEGYSKADYTNGTTSYDSDKKTFRIFGYTELRNSYLKNNDTDLEIVYYEKENLKNKELQMLEEKKNNTVLFNNKSNEKIDFSKLMHINDIYVKEYPEYMEIYYEHIMDHIKLGDYMPSGVYIDKNNNKLYIISISENTIYEYEIKNK